MKKVLHLSVVSAVVMLTALGYWGNVRAQTDSGGTTTQETEVTGVVDAFDATSVTVDGITYAITDTTELQGTLAIGATVKLEFVAGADGTLTATEVEAEDDAEDIDEDSSTDTEDELDDEDEDEVDDEDDSEDQSDDEDESDDESDDSSDEGDDAEDD